ncbi:MAG: hypothetical protein HKP58_01860 [Desulfatitalea sp.]|nr:hypothetical protein [Desulfatitalea sp.]NNJ99133.1 hypothetical protein [Desulfatitalea sp.]
MSNSESKATIKNPLKTRLPIVKTPAEVEALSNLSDEEKALALENLKKVPLSDGWALLGSDPELQAFMHLIEQMGTAFLEGDFQGTPFSPMNLVTLEAVRRSGNDYMHGLFSALLAVGIKSHKMGIDYYMKLGVLDNPDSILWTEEERLCLKFAAACLDNAMTDELFKQARVAWGEQKLLRLFFWLSFVNTWGMLNNMMNIKLSPEMLAPLKMGMPAELVEAIIAPYQKTRADMRALWDTVPHISIPGS